MKTSTILTTLIATLAFSACNPSEETELPGAGDDGTGRQAATLSSEVDLAEFDGCDAETPCPDGDECVALLDPDGGALTICVEPGQACALIECEGECIVAESYPVQLFCDSEGDDDDGDDDDGDVSANACGPTTCDEGLECCNALDGICVEPGGVCAL